ncbi:hypothetical protein O181_055715 [Austropuccinia psidii MF-1]|uniref:Integrase catalytic domain-containing protein n=1 Tax=Austropuccinia psidii MF-1 TaxID=1389203 RepID=A0A9Q3E4U1_9BASI|nr:hypothetical protein [Austropuccinia psidii MF-1]
MDWVTASPPGGEGHINAVLVLVDRCSKTPIFLPCHIDDTDIETAIIHQGLLQNIVSDRDHKFPSELLTNLHNLFGKKFTFSTAYHPQTDSVA